MPLPPDMDHGGGGSSKLEDQLHHSHILHGVITPVSTHTLHGVSSVLVCVHTQLVSVISFGVCTHTELMGVINAMGSHT